MGVTANFVCWLMKLTVVWYVHTGPLRTGLGPNKGKPAKNLYTTSARLTVSCRVILAWYERVNWYRRRIMELPREIKTYATYWGPGPLPVPRTPVIRTGFPTPPPPRHYVYTDVSEQPAASVFKNIALTVEAAGFKCRCAFTRLDGFTSLGSLLMQFPSFCLFFLV